MPAPRAESGPLLKVLRVLSGSDAARDAAFRGDVPQAPGSSHSRLAALRAAGTEHIYADTADAHELADAVGDAHGRVPQELDGNTANQPLVERIVEHHLRGAEPRSWLDAIAGALPPVAPRDRLPVLYAILCARSAHALRLTSGAGERWESSLQLHMDLCGRPRAGKRVGALLDAMVPGCLVKVPFAPDAPGCLLVARDLQREGIAVNLTSTFSARQVALAALLTDAACTNVFMGRPDAGLGMDGLGARVVARAQRVLSDLRRQDGLSTRLIVASVRSWTALRDLAGADVFTAPCEALGAFMERAPEELTDTLEERAGAARPPTPPELFAAAGEDALDALDEVDQGLLEFLRAYGRSREFRELEADQEEQLHERFVEAGFADLFHVPDASERRQIAQGKLPDLAGDLAGRIPLDTHYSLRANADFAAHQRAIDDAFREHLPARFDQEEHAA